MTKTMKTDMKVEKRELLRGTEEDLIDYFENVIGVKPYHPVGMRELDQYYEIEDPYQNGKYTVEYQIESIDKFGVIFFLIERDGHGTPEPYYAGKRSIHFDIFYILKTDE